jgi:hypothetical protein
LVGKATTDTLTNKTLTGAVMNGTLGATTPSTVAATTLTTSSTVTHNGGTANGVPYLNGSKVLTTGSALVFDGTNLGIGTSSPSKLLTIGSSTTANPIVRLNGSLTGGSDTYQYSFGLDDTADFAGIKLNYADRVSKGLQIFTASGYGFPITFSASSASTQMTLDTSGNLLVGATATAAYFDGKVNSYSASSVPSFAGKQGAATAAVNVAWTAATSGDNIFEYFVTEASPTVRGGINYNRAAGLVVYATTSDYRAKEISGPVVNSGVLIDSVPVYMGTMKGATQERPMFIAHETPTYAHTGEKDAVDKDGNPVYQQMDASALIPVMWAEIQSLRKRLAVLESA